MRFAALTLFIAFSVGMIAADGMRVVASAAEDRILTLSFGTEVRRLTASELLARPDTATITIPADPSYRRTMTYRAVPLIALIGTQALGAFHTIEARASDGFVSQLPAELVAKGAEKGSIAWIAIEDAAAPWPPLAGKQESAGPFYLVWQHPERSHVGTEQWPFALAALTGVEDPVRRWPVLAVDPALAPDAIERRGQAAFIKTCMACHRLNGAGEGDIGPDLGHPMNATAYITPAGLRALIRNPKSVRTWPAQQMPAFDTTTLPDADIDAIIAFLASKAAR